jgi:hypothetical protein
VKPLVWPATAYEVEELLVKMRPSDRREITFCAHALGRAVRGWSLEAETRKACAGHEVWAGFYKGELMALGGIAPLPDQPCCGAIWFLGTDLADKEWRAMTRACKRLVGIMAEGWCWVGNVVPAGMAKRIRWLEHIGFDMLESQAQLASIGLAAFSLRPHGPDA